MKTIASTQQFVPLTQIKNGAVILKNGGLRAVLQITPVNLALKSREDQEILVGQFQTFLNSLEFPIQLIVQSRKLDIFPYLNSLAEYSQNITADLLRLHAFDYIRFIQRLTELANIMDKRFFCVVPYDGRPMENPSLLKNLFSGRAKVNLNVTQLARYQEELNQRVGVISSGLEGLGLEVKPLDTQEIIEELYSIFNPEEASEERLEAMEKINAPIISASRRTKSAPLVLKKKVTNSAHALNEQPAPQPLPQPQPQSKPPAQPKIQAKPKPKPQPTSPPAGGSASRRIPLIDPQTAQDANLIIKNIQP